MKYNITEYDKNLVLQPYMNYKYRVYIVDDGKNILDEIQDIVSVGTYTVDADSDIRRTLSILISFGTLSGKSMEKRIHSWIGYHFQFQIGIYSLSEDSYRWYDCGFYTITSANTTYDATNNTLQLSLSDWYSNIEGTRNGQIGGAPVISIPNRTEEGVPVTIKDAVINILTGETKIRDYIIDDVGEFWGMPQNNNDYIQYRENNPAWNQLPYDLEYNAGCTVGDIFREIMDLYPNCQMYFDVYGNFCFHMIPSCEHDMITLSDSFVQEILVSDNSENVDYHIDTIKNVTEVFGSDYEIDRFSLSCTFDRGIYSISLDNYDKYTSYEQIAFTVTGSDAALDNPTAQSFIQINSLEPIPLYKEYSTDYMDSGTIPAGTTHVIRIRQEEGNYVAYYLGQYQPHALCVLTDNANDTVYTKSYFADKYNCNINNIVFRVEKDSPFTIQKLGEILDVKTGDEFDNIQSDSIALENAIYYNRQSTTVNDTVTLVVKMLPFLDVNIKVSYKKQQEDTAQEYIIKSVTHNMDSGTTQITMYKFYPLYFV